MTSHATTGTEADEPDGSKGSMSTSGTARVAASLIPFALASLVLAFIQAPLAAASAPSGGGRIVFSRLRPDGSLDIYTMRSNGSGVRRLTNDAFPDFNAAWSPDGSRIAFVTQRVGHFNEIFTMDPRGRNPRVTHNSFNESDVAWSPSGKRLAFTRTGGPKDSEIYTVKLDCTGLRRLTRNHTEDSEPSWSPDGSRIAYTCAGLQICTMNVHGHDVRQVTRDGGSQPAWSPDGKRILLVGSRTNDLFTIGSGGGSTRRLTRTGKNEASPSWSSDGKNIVYVAWRGNAEAGMELFAIFTIHADGSHRTKLSPDDRFLDRWPDWQPIPA